MMLRRQFANAVGYLNTVLSEEDHLKFIHWDFHKFAKRFQVCQVLAVLGAVASEALDLSAFYFSGKLNNVKKRTNKPSRASTGREASVRYLRASSWDHLSSIGSNDKNLNSVTGQDREADLGQQNEKENHVGEAAHFQSGILCTNCIDCLDRTNVAQYGYGLAALGHRLHAMGLTDNPKVDPDSSIAAALMDIYIRAWEMLLHSNMEALLPITLYGFLIYKSCTKKRVEGKADLHSCEFVKLCTIQIFIIYLRSFQRGKGSGKLRLRLGNFLILSSNITVMPILTVKSKMQ
ncbi:hypothetical protein SLEP1_g20659 [Rubroshorea leprosula]|nr:hypothetical protein SLEP1_g20659 [Rubroshorea leprosula]